MRIGFALTMMSAAGMVVAPLGAQVRTIDPNQAPAPARGDTPPMAAPTEAPADSETNPAPPVSPAARSTAAEPTSASGDARHDAAAEAANDGYEQRDVLDAAEGVFGKGASGLGKVIEDIFKKQGRPTAYVAGREAGGAIIAGVRYGSGTLFHKVEGQRPIFWAGPSVGFDLGANGAKTFVLIYNLYDSQELYKRFPAVEGSAYVVGGFTVSYMRWGKVVVIPIRLGVGWRLGANLGYMRFSEKSRWSPF